MPVKIRLQRHGKKGKPFYWVVAADARAKATAGRAVNQVQLSPLISPEAANQSYLSGVLNKFKGKSIIETCLFCFLNRNKKSISVNN